MLNMRWDGQSTQKGGSLWPRGVRKDMEEAVLELDFEGLIGISQVV